MSDLEASYRKRYELVLKPLAQALEKQLKEYFEHQSRIDRISARPKSIARFLKKANTTVEGKQKYEEPLRQIQDQIGARIVTFYVSDVDRIADVALKYFRPIESQTIVPDSEWEFGYFGRHYIFLIPSDLMPRSVDRDMLPDFFELQVKTLFQHAWSEADHDLGYKPEAPLSSDAKRRLAFTSAQAWGADRVFDKPSKSKVKKLNQIAEPHRFIFEIISPKNLHRRNYFLLSDIPRAA